MVEMICDKIAAGMAYNKDNWTTSQPLDYWLNIEKLKPTVVHPATTMFIETVFQNLAEYGIKATINRKYLKQTYNNIAKEFNLSKSK